MTELDLTKVLDRHTVKMPDGTAYELRNPEEFGLMQKFHLEKLLERSRELDALEAPTEADMIEGSKLLREFASILILDLGDTVVDDWVCEATFSFWMSQQNVNAPEVAPDGPPPSPRTGGASSRASKRSTGATRKAGGRSRSGS